MERFRTYLIFVVQTAYDNKELAKWLLNKKRSSTFLHAQNCQDKFNHSNPFYYVLGIVAQKAFLANLCHGIDINAFPLDWKEKISSFWFPMLDAKSNSTKILHVGAVTVLKFRLKRSFEYFRAFWSRSLVVYGNQSVYWSYKTGCYNMCWPCIVRDSSAL